MAAAPEDPEAVQLWMVRHGETEWSRTGRHTSVTDLPLTDHGTEVARDLAPRLAEVSFDLVLTSPRTRARVTATLVGFPDAVVDEDLAEWAYGDYEGVSTADIREERPDWDLWTDGCPGGESPAQVGARLDRVVERVRDRAGRTLVFAHGHSLRVLAARWLELPVASGRHFDLDTSTVSRLGYERTTPVVQRWNS